MLVVSVVLSLSAFDSSGAKPSVDGNGGPCGGLDVNRAVLARIAVLGTRQVEKDLPFRLHHHEWPIVAASYRNATPSAAPAT
ncbi:hypothetical protein ACZ90_20180 [Streptomyces albus subsp. albus]|nr:hypothetical protein ACZ90_20180 [Streptomyces albus subsp. albus]